MKKYGFYLIIAVIIASLSSCAGEYVVTERPADVVYSRPIAPGSGYVWISGDWVWTGGRYQWREGRWDRPRAGRAWREGQWQNTGRGYKWRSGHWDRH